MQLDITNDAAVLVLMDLLATFNISNHAIHWMGKAKYCSFKGIVLEFLSVWAQTQIGYWSFRIFEQPFKCYRVTKIQSFQFRIIHRIIPCNQWLKNVMIKWTMQLLRWNWWHLPFFPILSKGRWILRALGKLVEQYQ